MRIAIGADHGGFELKEKLITYLKNNKHVVKDCGSYTSSSVDYPSYGFTVARLVASKEYDRGILLCKTGIGMSIVANKVKGIRAALCLSQKMAISSRQHNCANVLVLPASYVETTTAFDIVSKWLETNCEGGRHKRRIDAIENYEENNNG
ncbi:ribose 5-phosphate isomerase B [Chlamydiota bacterium]